VFSLGCGRGRGGLMEVCWRVACGVLGEMREDFRMALSLDRRIASDKPTSRY
jgi:hypothetical protein